jgi:hypothetical protein
MGIAAESGIGAYLERSGDHATDDGDGAQSQHVPGDDEESRSSDTESPCLFLPLSA